MEFGSLDIMKLRKQLMAMYRELCDMRWSLFETGDEIDCRYLLESTMGRIGEANGLLKEVFDDLDKYEMEHREES